MRDSSPATSNTSRPRRGAARAAKQAVVIRMLSIVLGAFVLVAAILSIDANGFAATYVFNTSSTLALWNTSASWTPNNGVDYPGTAPGDTAIIATSGTANLSSPLPNDLAALTLDGLATISLNSTAGNLITIAGTFDFFGGTVTGPGSMLISTPALLNFASSSNVFLGATLNNSGTINYAQQPTSTLQITASGLINNSGLFNLLNDTPIDNDPAAAPGNIHNLPGGTLRKTAGVPPGPETISPTLTNDGVVDVQAGRLGINAGGTVFDSGQFTIATNAALEIQTGTHILTNFNLPSNTPSITGGEVQVDGPANTPAFLQIGGSGDSGGAIYDVTRTTLPGGALDPNNPTIPAKTDILDMNSLGTINGSGDFLLRLSGTVTGGQILGLITNHFTVAPAATMTFNPTTNTDLIANVTFVNQGRVNYITGPFTFTISSFNTFIHNDPGATWDFQGDDAPLALVGGQIFRTRPDAVNALLRTQPAGGLSSPSEFFNDGLLEKTGANTLSATSNITIHVTNTGTIDALAGTINFVQGMTQTAGTTHLANGSPGTPAIASPTGQTPGVSINLNGGTLTGGGAVGGDLNNNSANILPGSPTTIDAIAVTGNYTQGATGALTLKLAAGSNDQLNTKLADTLSGTLNLQSFGGFTASNGTTFTILNYGSETGAFTTVNPVGLNSAFVVNYFPTFATATAVVPSILINNVTANEGNSGTTPFTFTVTLSAPNNQQAITVNYATADGTATAGSDYVTTSGTLTFAPGVTSQTITVPVIGDTLSEPDETFTVNLFGASPNATIGVASGTGSIVNDDGVPLVSIDNVAQAEGDIGTTPFVFTATLSAPSAQTVTVRFATADGSATAGVDYTATSGTLTFAPGVTSQTITVQVNGDTVAEPDETFTVTLSAPSNATLATATGTGTIVNDDSAAALSINNVSQAEGNSGTTPFVFTVTLSGTTTLPVSVNFATADGSATAGVDYTATSGTLTFAPGVTSQTITVPVIGDTVNEPSETFTLTLSAPTNATITTGSGVGTIVNDDSGCGSGPTNLFPLNGAQQVPTSGVLQWAAAGGATSYNVYLASSNGCTTLFGTTSSTSLPYSNLAPDTTYQWRVEAISTGCPSASSICQTFTTAAATACNPPEKPVITANGEATTGQPYFISWTPSTVTGQFQLQESPNADFTGPQVRDLFVSGNTSISPAFQHDVTVPTPFFYRVRGFSSCVPVGGPPVGAPPAPLSGPFSDVARVVVIPIPALDELNPDITTPVGSTKPIVQTFFVPGIPGQTWNFLTSSDEPWLTVAPPSGILPPEGVSLTVTADPTNLANGTHTGTAIVTLVTLISGNARRTVANDTVPPPPVNTAVSINVVTPITPISKTQPSPNTLIIPAVGHVSGADSKWQSDIRLTNNGLATQKYQVTFTPSGTDARLSSKATIITAAPAATIALDDIVKRWYGLGSLNDGANGALEIRPVTVGNSIGGKPGTVTNDISVSTVTLASSRTYNTTPNGTLGQFIPALQFSSFVGLGNSTTPSAILSLQQIAQSAAYRTNFGIIEGSGQPVSVLARILDNQGHLLGSVPINLKAGEHQQLDNFLGKANITNLADGRIEVSVVSGTGRVMSYASVIDNKTNDPLLINGQLVGQNLSRNFVVPGVADLNTGVANWRTDMRIFNSGAPNNVTLTFFPEGPSPTGVSKSVTVNTNEVLSIDNLLQSEFGLTNVGGSLRVTSVVDSPLIISARTFNQTNNGTFGQFVPAVTVADAVGAGERSLNILQVEDSDRFRTNLGLVEVSGQPATVEVSAVFSDAKVTPKFTFQVPANGFVQSRLLNALGLSHAQTYNARLVIRVTGGAGKIAAYGSVIDAKTQDPTYVPAQ